MIKVKPPKTTTPAIPRITEWTAPTGRKLVPDTLFEVEGQKGKWKFRAYVDHPTAPYVEATKAGKAKTNIRCFDPDKIHTVSNKKGGPE